MKFVFLSFTRSCML